MKIFNTTLLIASLCLTHAATAQHAHSDIEFSYVGGKIDIEFGDEGNIFEGDFETSGVIEQETDDPGFDSEAEEGLGVNPGDIIDYLILAPLTYHNGTDFAPVPTGASIIIEDNPTGGLTVDALTVGPVSGSGAIAEADALGDVHTHIEFILDPLSLDAPEFGAYGLLMQLTTDAVGIAASEPFFIVFNFGLEEGEGNAFEGAVEAFAASVPEPTSLMLVGFVLASASLRRKV